jgi:hypothetical protein
LSQQAVPSAGWAQQAPLCASFDTLGVQQALSLTGCVQQLAAGSCVSSLFFSNDAIVCVSIFSVFE